MKQLRLPTLDHFEPSVDSLQEAIKFIKEFKDRGQKVYIHCKAGHGRAAATGLLTYSHLCAFLEFLYHVFNATHAF